MGTRKEVVPEYAATEIDAYSKITGVYDQAFTLQGQLITLLNGFVVVTGAIWSAAATNALHLGREPRVLLLSLHLLACFWVLPVVIGIRSSIALRLKFVSEAGGTLFPELARLGARINHEIYGRSRERPTWKFRLARWGRQNWFWFSIPIGSLLGSAYLLVRLFTPALTWRCS